MAAAPPPTTFPQKLHEIISDEANHDTIRWVNDGAKLSKPILCGNTLDVSCQSFVVMILIDVLPHVLVICRNKTDEFPETIESLWLPTYEQGRLPRCVFPLQVPERSTGFVDSGSTSECQTS